MHVRVFKHPFMVGWSYSKAEERLFAFGKSFVPRREEILPFILITVVFTVCLLGAAGVFEDIFK